MAIILNYINNKILNKLFIQNSEKQRKSSFEEILSPFATLCHGLRRLFTKSRKVLLSSACLFVVVVVVVVIVIVVYIEHLF